MFFRFYQRLLIQEGAKSGWIYNLVVDFVLANPIEPASQSGDVFKWVKKKTDRSII